MHVQPGRCRCDARCSGRDGRFERRRDAPGPRRTRWARARRRARQPRARERLGRRVARARGSAWVRGRGAVRGVVGYVDVDIDRAGGVS